MSELSLERQLDVVSGNAEARIQQDRYTIAAEQQQREDELHNKRDLKRQMAAGEGLKNGLLPAVAAMNSHEVRQFSVSRLVNAISKAKKDQCLETDLSDAICGDLGTPPHGGTWLPLSISASGLDTKSNSGGNYLVQTSVSKNIADALRASCMVLRLGAEFIAGVKYSLALPVESNVMVANWIGGENTGVDATASDSSFAQRLMKPHAMIATTSCSRQLLTQSSDNLDKFITSRIAKAHGQLLDSAAINGSGNAPFQPVGVLNYAGIPVVSIGSNGGALAASHLIALETAVAAANGDQGNLSFLTNSAQRAKLRAIPEFASGTLPLWRDGKMLSYRAESSNQVPATLTKGSAIGTCSAVIFGNFSAITIVAFEGAVELTVDPYAGKKQGEIEISSYCSYDLGITTTGSLATIQDAL